MKAEQHIRAVVGLADPARNTTISPPPVTPAELIARADNATRQRRRPLPRRRLVLLGGATMAAAAVVAAGGLWNAGAPATSGSDDTTTRASISGQEILLAAATTAEKTSLGSGAYWYTKVGWTDSRSGGWSQAETWTARDGRAWSRWSEQNPVDASASSPALPPDQQEEGTVVEVPQPNPLSLGGAKVTIEQVEALPGEAAALKARIAELVDSSDIRTSAGKLTAAQKQEHVFQGLVSLVSLLPAPPNVRAAALRAIAAYPNVKSLGAIEGGQGLLISFFPGEPPARLVIDPRTGHLRQTNVLIPTDGGLSSLSDGGTFTVTSEWTNTLPQ